MLDEDGTPLRRRYICPEEGKAIEYDEIVRGYEIEDDRFIVVTDDELEALEPLKSRDIDLRRFVPQDDIDPMYFERGYFLAPGGGSTKAYRLLAETMEQMGVAGVATFVMRTKEYLVAILAENGILRAETLRFADEIRTAEDVGLPDRPKRQSRKAADAIAKEIRKAVADEIDEAELEDPYAGRLLALVEKKRKQRTDVVRTKVEAEDDDDVIDLMALLKKRLGSGAGAKPATTKPASAKKSAGGARTRAGSTKKSTARNGGARKTDVDDLDDASKEELYERAKKLDIAGRSGMSKPQLIRAIRRSA
jgi:DNA end-binding protein Ku